RLSRRSTQAYAWCCIGLLAILTLGVTGAIAGLADTLFHSSSIIEGFHREFSGPHHMLLRLRIIHPALALVVGAFLVILALRTLRVANSIVVRRLAECLLALVLLQFAFGLLNLLLLTPLWMQILHLLAADLLWITLLLLSVEMLACSFAGTAEDV